MAKILPFKGVFYNTDKIEDLNKVTSPPYDIIKKGQQDKYYAKDEKNFVRLILGKDNPEDNDDNNRYSRAAEYFKKWMTEGVLKKDDAESIYLLQQKYTYRGQEKKVLGFIALAQLEEIASKKILPHEKTLSNPKADRLKLLKATDANLEQIYVLYPKHSKQIDEKMVKLTEGKPLLQVVDDNGVENTVWRITDQQMISDLQKEMEDNILFIADGHHRYETSLNYAKEKKTNGSWRESYNSILMFFTPIENDGLTVLPTHRTVFGLQNYIKDNLIEQLKGFFEVKVEKVDVKDPEAVQKFNDSLEELGKKYISFGLYLGQGEMVTICAKEPEKYKVLMDKNASEHIRELDVAVLHSVILEKILSISKDDLLYQKKVHYTRSEEEAIKEVDAGNAQLSFILNPTKIEQIKNVSENGELMPQKSTYFYPKLVSGLVLRTFD